MPTYQYACTSTDCGNEFELVQSFTDPNASECPTCGGPVRKVFSAVGVVFKGSGFYRTDSRKSGASTDGGGGKSEKSSDKSGEKTADKSTGKVTDKSGDKAASSSSSSDSGSSSASKSTASSSAKAAASA
jgi:putative FmdB family regulatory protein